MTNTAAAISLSKENTELLAQAYEQIERALSKGELICIFPEGHITYTGDVDEFRPGIEKIIRHRTVPVVPMALSGLWGTFFSRKGGQAMRSLPKPLWFKIVLRIGQPLPAAEVEVDTLQKAVISLGSPVSAI